MSRVQAIRGATTLGADSAEQMLERVPEMLEQMFSTNGITDSEVISAMFTATPDITSMFPPTAARARFGMADVPMIGAVEMDVADSLPLCVRVLLHIETSRPRRLLAHVYLHGAVALRPDLTNG